MDVLTHALIGAMIAELALWDKSLPERKRGWIIGGVIASAPDLGNLPAHFIFSWQAGDWPWEYLPSHWQGKSDSLLLTPYWITHSLILSLILFLFFRKQEWRSWPILAWSSHSVIDILSHTGPWSIRPLWPIPWKLEGMGDPWAWSPAWWALCIAISGCCFYSVTVMTSNWRANAQDTRASEE